MSNLPRVIYTGDGVTTNFTIPFPYISRSHVVVRVGEPIVTNYTFINDTTIEFDEPPADGATINIRRVTPNDFPIYTIQNGVPLAGENLQTNFLQALWAAEEAFFADQSEVASVADRLATPRTINGVPFDGSQNITVRAAPNNSELRTFYVAEDGVNNALTNRGRNPDRPVRTIEYAIQRIEELGVDSGWTIVTMTDLESPGEIALPPRTAVQGRWMQRRHTIRPTPGNEVRNVFLMDNGCHVANLRFAGWRHDNLDNPTKGFAMAFKPGAIILPGGVPYGQNCVVSQDVTEVPTPLPGDPGNQNPAQPIGMGCAIADGSVLSAYSVYPNIMTWGFTPACKNGIGYLAKNRAHINCVNAIGLAAHVHFMAQDGGNLVLSACSSQFGDFSLWSEGSIFRTEPLKVDPALVTTATNARSVLNSIKAATVSNSFAFMNGLKSWTQTQQALIQKDTGLLVDAIGVCLQFGTEDPMLNATEGFFKFDGDAAFPYSDLVHWVAGLEFVRDYIINNTSFSGAANDFIEALFDRMIATLQNYFFETGEGPSPAQPERVRRRMRSLVTAISHQWTAPLAGTQFFRVPPAKQARAIQRSIVKRNGGQIKFSGQDDQGNAVFVGGLTIDARSGELGGPPFEQAIRNRILTNSIAASY